MEQDYGQLQYEYSDAVSSLDMTKSQRKRHLKSFTAIFILLCTTLIAVWCVWNFVLDLKLYTSSSVINYYIPLLIVVLIIMLIAVLSVFGLWGKFMRAVTKFYRPHDVQARQRLDEIKSDLDAADNRKATENAVAIYENAIIITVKGEKKFIDRSTRYSAKMTKLSHALLLSFDGEYTGNVNVNRLLPSSDAYLIKKALGDKLTVTEVPKTPKRKRTKHKRDRKEKKPRRTFDFSFADVEVGAIVAGGITILVGIAVTIIGYFDLMNGMPPSVGGFVIMLGLMFVCLAFINFDLVQVFVIKIAAAAMLIYMGIVFLLIIEAGVTAAPVTFNTLLRHPSIYGIACLFFVSVGVSLIPNAIKSLIEYIKYL